MKIEKKAWPDFFGKVASGDKNFDLRIADWDINVGDTLVLREWDPQTKDYTGRQVEREVTYLIKTKEAEKLGMWPREDIEEYGFQVIGFRPDD